VVPAERQVDALEFSAGVDIEEQRLALVGNPHGHLVLLFQEIISGLPASCIQAGVRRPPGQRAPWNSGATT
jgi:hypothetical protein